MIAFKPEVIVGAPTARTLSITKRLGLAIYRCDYSDESQWKSYMYYFKRAVKDELRDIGAPLSVWARMRWTIIEDQKSLEGISKEDVQKRFATLNEQSLTIKIPPQINSGWHFSYDYESCICVDRRCLDTLDLHEAWLDRGARGPFQPVLCAILNDTSTSGKETRLARESTDETKRPYVGWVYAHVACLSALCPSVTLQYPMAPHRMLEHVDKPNQH